jgi:1-acyl-sn-glycerol-3-phosphate acyltransferase
MIRAAPHPVAQRIFHGYIFRELKKHFQAFYMLNEFPAIPEGRRLLITPNHFSWWDGFFIDYLCTRLLKRQIYLMMLEEQLRRYWYFKMFGAYSIDPGNTPSVIETLQYTIEPLMDPANYVVMYPQGVLEPYDKRPIVIKQGGLRYIITHAPHPFLIFPIGFRVTYYDEKHPEISVRMGDIIESEAVKDNFNHFRKKFIHNLEELDTGTFERRFIRDLFQWKP